MKKLTIISDPDFQVFDLGFNLIYNLASHSSDILTPAV